MRTTPSMDIQWLLDNLDLSFDIAGDTQALISCGYFDAPTGIDDFSRSSMLAGLRLGESLNASTTANLPAQYTVLINDLGMDCSEDTCDLTTVRSEDIDTGPLQEIAGTFAVTFSVVRERTLRNRSARKIKNWLKTPESDPTLHLEGNEILFDSNSYPRVIAGAINKAGVGIPRCPLIVSEFEDISFRSLQRNSLATSRIMFDFVRVADRDKVIKGTEMYLKRRSRASEGMVLIFFDSETGDFIPMTYSSEDYR